MPKRRTVEWCFFPKSVEIEVDIFFFFLQRPLSYTFIMYLENVVGQSHLPLHIVPKQISACFCFTCLLWEVKNEHRDSVIKLD